LYAFAGQKSDSPFSLMSTNVFAFTNKRIIVATKRLLFGYFFRMVTPDMFNDLTLKQGIFWGRVIIDTVKEKVILSNIDINALPEIDDHVTMYMLEQKKKDKEESKEE